MAYYTGESIVRGPLVALSDVLYQDTFWDDLRVPAVQVNLSGPAAAPAYNAAEITLDFSATQINTVQFDFQLPHTYKEGTDVIFHAHFKPSTANAGDIVWEHKVRWSNVGDVVGAFATTSQTEAAAGVEDEHDIGASKTLDGAGKRISSVIQLQLQRLGNDVADSFTGLVQALSFDLHFQINTPGSREPLAK